MKYVKKAGAPASFEKWKQSGGADWQPDYASLQSPEKKELHRSLLQEQAWVCCYCGRGIDEDSSHIEHFYPRASYPDRGLDYNNLHASCIRATNPGEPLHCGHAKGDKFNEDLYISPLDETCEQRFLYTWDGQILPASSTDQRAEYMRDLLKLDISFLRNRRAELLRQVFSPDFLKTVNEEDLRRLQQACCGRKGNKTQSFGHVLARFIEQLLSTNTQTATSSIFQGDSCNQTT